MPSEFQIEGGKLLKYLGEGGDVVIPRGITEIGEDAFSYSAAVSVRIPDTVERIGRFAFAECKQLRRVEFMEGCRPKEYADDVFLACSALEEFALPAGVKAVPRDFLCACDALKKVVLPEGIERIGDGAFSRCFALQSINFPQTLRVLEGCALYWCKSLREIKLPAGLEEIGKWCFDGCGGIRALEIPQGVTRIPFLAFAQCFNLKTLTLPKGLKEIEDGAFSDNYALEEIRFDGTVRAWKKLTQSVTFHKCESIPRKTADGYERGNVNRAGRRFGPETISVVCSDGVLKI